jgi:anti-sigma factor RsiW
LDPYLDGELDAALSREVDSHSVECVACSSLRIRKEALRRTLRSIPVTPQ